MTIELTSNNGPPIAFGTVSMNSALLPAFNKKKSVAVVKNRDLEWRSAGHPCTAGAHLTLG